MTSLISYDFLMIFLISYNCSYGVLDVLWFCLCFLDFLWWSYDFIRFLWFSWFIIIYDFLISYYVFSWFYWFLMIFLISYIFSYDFLDFLWFCLWLIWFIIIYYDFINLFWSCVMWENKNKNVAEFGPFKKLQQNVFWCWWWVGKCDVVVSLTILICNPANANKC